MRRILAKSSRKCLRNHLFHCLKQQFLSIFRRKVHLPRPLLPTNRRSLNLATWFFMTAVQFRNSPHQLSSFPARIVTMVPSPTSLKATTLKATGRVLLERQWFGRAEHKIYGLPVRTAINFETIKKYFIITSERCIAICVNANVLTRKAKARQLTEWRWWFECNKDAHQIKFQARETQTSYVTTQKAVIK